MSVPTTQPPGAPAGSSLGTIRQLFEQRLVERASQLAETRWPGSGQMVSLANDWAHLTPAARRERLAAIGPADLARLRRLADLQPDLARVLDDLERRGVLPPAEELETTTESREELLVDTAMHAGESAMRDVAQREHLRQAAPEAAGRAVPLNAPTPLAQVDWPELDLGLPTTDEVLAVEAERRRAAAEAAEAALERVRARVERNATRLLAPPPERPAAAVDRDPVVEAEVPVVALAVVPPPTVRAALAEAVARDVAHVVSALSDAEARALGEELGLPVATYTLEPGATKALFGGLERGTGGYTTQLGPLPRALNSGALVIIRGRPWPKMVERWQAGYCDIPGTQATTPLSPRSRIIIVPPED